MKNTHGVYVGLRKNYVIDEKRDGIRSGRRVRGKSEKCPSIGDMVEISNCVGIVG